MKKEVSHVLMFACKQRNGVANEDPERFVEHLLFIAEKRPFRGPHQARCGRYPTHLGCVKN